MDCRWGKEWRSKLESPTCEEGTSGLCAYIPMEGEHPTYLRHMSELTPAMPLQHNYFLFFVELQGTEASQFPIRIRGRPNPA